MPGPGPRTAERVRKAIRPGTAGGSGGYNPGVPVLVDLDSRRIAASVTDLLEETGRRTIGLQGAGRARTWLGRRLHTRLQEQLAAEDPDFQAEVTVRRVLDVDGWEVEIQGRADGVVERGGVVERVDEIKTLHFATELFASLDRDHAHGHAHRAQGLLVALERPAVGDLALGVPGDLAHDLPLREGPAGVQEAGEEVQEPLAAAGAVRHRAECYAGAPVRSAARSNRVQSSLITGESVRGRCPPQQ